ncbi:MAG: phosphatidate cytidylyltransferase [Pirellulales bacterium]|nr:phosphatidate cytidylyltransferase [Pirellulales bacterium]
MHEDLRTLSLVCGVLGLLTIVTIVGQFLKRNPDTGLNAAAVRTFNLRIRAWWTMCAILATAFFIGKAWTVGLFFLISFHALREFITITPTRPADHFTLFLALLLIAPLQYLLVGFDRYELYNVFIPVYAFLFVPTSIALSGDFKRYLERVAKIQAGLMICVYCLSFAPALLYLRFHPVLQETPYDARGGANYPLLFFFIFVVQMGDALQYIWSKLVGRHVMVASISPNRTWEGFVGGIASNTLLGAALWWAIPPLRPEQAAGLALLASILGFAGGLTMSAIKRDRGVKDYGTLVEGHGGILDRIDSICFAAPVFFHVTRMMFGQG